MKQHNKKYFVKLPWEGMERLFYWGDKRFFNSEYDAVIAARKAILTEDMETNMFGQRLSYFKEIYGIEVDDIDYFELYVVSSEKPLIPKGVANRVIDCLNSEWKAFSFNEGHHLSHNVFSSRDKEELEEYLSKWIQDKLDKFGEPIVRKVADVSVKPQTTIREWSPDNEN